MSDKSLLNNVDGYAVLQTDVSTDFSSTIPRLASAIRSLSRPAWIARSTFREANLSESIKSRPKQVPEEALYRAQLYTAFGPIMETPQKFSDSVPGHQSGSFDGPSSVIAEDLAPYVRCIVTADIRLEQQRLELSKLLSQGGKSGKTRTTRASRAALEGGNKATTRKERYLPKRTNFNQVLSTGSKSWQEALISCLKEEAREQGDLGISSCGSFPGSSAESSVDE